MLRRIGFQFCRRLPFPDAPDRSSGAQIARAIFRNLLRRTIICIEPIGAEGPAPDDFPDILLIISLISKNLLIDVSDKQHIGPFIGTAQQLQ